MRNNFGVIVLVIVLAAVLTFLGFFVLRMIG